MGAGRGMCGENLYLVCWWQFAHMTRPAPQLMLSNLRLLSVKTRGVSQGESLPFRAGGPIVRPHLSIRGEPKCLILR